VVAGFIAHLVADLSPAELVDADVGERAVEPGGDGPARGVGRAGGEALEQRALHGVLGVGAIAEHAEGHRVEPARVRLDRPDESALVHLTEGIRPARGKGWNVRADLLIILPMSTLDRRRFLTTLGAAAALGLSWPPAASADDPILAGRPLVRYPEKTDLILLTSRPPQLETPMRYFDRAITPNEAFFVRYHTFPTPTSVDLGTWRLRVGGRVDHPLELTLDELKSKFPRAALAAALQCSGNSRGRFAPRVLGGEWGDGAMGNAEWVGARLRDVLAAAGVRQGSVQVTFEGLDKPAFPTVPQFVKSLDVARVLEDPDVLIAYQMNGADLPMLNGYPVRLIVPGWYATYWVKHLTSIEVIDHTLETFWMKPAYRIPDTACGCVEPGKTPARTVPINRMTVRSFIAAPETGTRLAAGQPVALKGIAFDGGYGIREVQISDDGGTTWRRAQLGVELGRYAFREWSVAWTPPRAGAYRLLARAVNRIGESQGYEALWNPAGYLRNVIESVDVEAR
jgi:DMSO/TMAO reductase YedYZ molybdopterin-dependent catalytic subunit